jgi:hypothetical protein
VQLLRWAEELGFRVTWNVLCGFPGETAQDYEGMTDVIKAIPHLQPPASFSAFRLDRFSPMFDNAEAYGLANAEPYPSYRSCYPGLDVEALRSIAYFYRYDPPLADETAKAIHGAWLATEDWRATHRDGTLIAIESPLFLLIEDTRAGRERRQYLLSGVDRLVYRAASAVTTVSMILAAWDDRLERPTAGEIGAALDRFVKLGLMMVEDERYLGLALFGDDSDPLSSSESSAQVRRPLARAEPPRAAALT